jgi:hypothetical protein
MRSSGKTWNTRSGLRCELYGMSYELVLPELQVLGLAFASRRASVRTMMVDLGSSLSQVPTAGTWGTHGRTE